MGWAAYTGPATTAGDGGQSLTASVTFSRAYSAGTTVTALYSWDTPLAPCDVKRAASRQGSVDGAAWARQRWRQPRRHFRARHGYQDAPRRPCYRAVRRR